MRARIREKEIAITLRRKGHSYRDILRSVPVSKSTLSDWLKELPLTRGEKTALKRATDRNITRGRIRAAGALRDLRLERERALHLVAAREYRSYREDPFFSVGIALYWGEGSKRHGGFAFTNSDPEMVAIMVRWIERFLATPRHMIKARLYLHRSYAHERLETYWIRSLRLSPSNLYKSVYKPSALAVKKRPDYKGCFKIIIDKVSLRLKMQYWQRMLIEEYRKK